MPDACFPIRNTRTAHAVGVPRADQQPAMISYYPPPVVQTPVCAVVAPPSGVVPAV